MGFVTLQQQPLVPRSGEDQRHSRATMSAVRMRWTDYRPPTAEPVTRRADSCATLGFRSLAARLMLQLWERRPREPVPENPFAQANQPRKSIDE